MVEGPGRCGLHSRARRDGEAQRGERQPTDSHFAYLRQRVIQRMMSRTAVRDNWSIILAADLAAAGTRRSSTLEADQPIGGEEWEPWSGLLEVQRLARC